MEFADKWFCGTGRAASRISRSRIELPRRFVRAAENRRLVRGRGRRRHRPDTGFATRRSSSRSNLGPDAPKLGDGRDEECTANRDLIEHSSTRCRQRKRFANRKGTKLGQKAEVPPTDEAAPSEDGSRDALIKFVAEKNYPIRPIEFRDADPSINGSRRRTMPRFGRTRLGKQRGRGARRRSVASRPCGDRKRG